jgi:penicillin-binding protein 1A
MTVSSYNTAYAALIQDVGPSNAVAMAHRLGITTPINSVPAAVLGSENVTALDMANSYATFANSGVHVGPVFVDQIEKADGTILWQHAHTQERVISAPIADTITDILSDALNSGTGTRARIGRPAAGKTGTGVEFRDAWFVGYTPQLSTAVWVGYPDAQITMPGVFGGTYPAQIWSAFMGPAMESRPVIDFPPPPEDLVGVPGLDVDPTDGDVQGGEA